MRTSHPIEQKVEDDGASNPNAVFRRHHPNPPTLATPPRLPGGRGRSTRPGGLQVWPQLRSAAPAHLHLTLQLPGPLLQEAPPAAALRGHHQAQSQPQNPRGWAVCAPWFPRRRGQGNARGGGRRGEGSEQLHLKTLSEILWVFQIPYKRQASWVVRT